MTFPDTQLTLIARLARGGSDEDWRIFVNDYWGPLVRFASRAADATVNEAEDIAAETFLLLFRSSLLARWREQPTGKLRSYLCGVVRNLLANQRRVALGRQRLLTNAALDGGIPGMLLAADVFDPPADDLDMFYRAWVDDLLAKTMKSVMAKLHAEGRGDYFRALYGRVCEGLSAEAIGGALGISAASVENYLRVGKSRLHNELREMVRQQVSRYSAPDVFSEQFEREWAELGTFLEQHGGLEGAIRAEAASIGRLGAQLEQSPSFIALQNELRVTAKKLHD